MSSDTALLEGVRDVLRADTRIGFDEQPIALTLSNGDLVMEGEVADVSAKRRALQKAAEAIQGRSIVDRLHVRPAVAMQDGEIRDLVRDALLQEPALSQCRVRECVKGDLQPVRDPPDATGTIDIRWKRAILSGTSLRSTSLPFATSSRGKYISARSPRNSSHPPMPS
jgi:osmotically-inducible protein OsmY